MRNDSLTLPAFFETFLAEQYAAADVRRILDGCAVDRATTLRCNTLLSSHGEVAGALDTAGLAWQAPPWYDDAFALAPGSEPQLRQLDVYDQGKVYLQSLSSMIPPLALNAQPGQDICDMCAAPGGKTTQIVALTGGRAYVTACEMHEPRAQKLEHNLAKLGAANVTVLRQDARIMDDFFSFDRVLVDAPCSGSGTLRAGDPRMAKRFTPKLVEKSRKSQAALLDKALRMVKPGGIVVYSTCSVLQCENEDIVEQALKRNRKRGSFELQSIDPHDPARVVETDEEPGAAERGRAPREDAAEPIADGGASAADSPNVAPAATAAGPAPAELSEPTALPLLPTRLEGALCLAPTDLYEGFFVAKIKRLA